MRAKHDRADSETIDAFVTNCLDIVLVAKARNTFYRVRFPPIDVPHGITHMDLLDPMETFKSRRHDSTMLRRSLRTYLQRHLRRIR